VKALRAGKHVYSAVPAGITLDEIRELVKTVEETGKIYMMGETSYYYPGAVFCRDKFQKGEFGHVVYGEAEYYHDWDHGLYAVMKERGGERWIETAGSPPMHYPTHSTSQIISVTGARMTHVSCQGFVDRKEDVLYGPGTNKWGNAFSNQTALFTMSDGSCCRVSEFRRVGYFSVERMSLYGTEACFENKVLGVAWLHKNSCESLDAQLKCGDNGYAAVHDAGRLPKEFAGLGNGHAGSHHFLADDFVKACVTGKTPPVNVWMAARYTVPGIIAHESSLQGGALLEIPDFGGPK
jgi:predicted dehydrogenase